jgi:hypothetical protein
MRERVASVDWAAFDPQATYFQSSGRAARDHIVGCDPDARTADSFLARGVASENSDSCISMV